MVIEFERVVYCVSVTELGGCLLARRWYWYFIRNDIAILELDRPVVGVQPMPINTSGTPHDGTEGVIVGFGSVKYVADPEAWNNRGGNVLVGVGIKRQGDVSTSPCPRHAPDQGRFVCYGGPSASPQQARACYGDSGGGLYSVGASPMVMGITSTGCMGHDVDTDVFSYSDWIRDRLATIAGRRSSESELCGNFACLTRNDVISGIEYLSYGMGISMRSFVYRIPPDVTKVIITLNGQENDDENISGTSDFRVNDYGLECKLKKVGQFYSREINRPTAGDVTIPVIADRGSGLFQITASLLRGQRPQDMSASHGWLRPCYEKDHRPWWRRCYEKDHRLDERD